MSNKAVGKTAAHHKLIKRLFKGLPVVDAKEEMIINAIKADIRSAKRGSHNTAFFRNFAYVEKGDKIERFYLPKATRDSILVFDKAGKTEPGGYILRPPSPGQTLDRRMETARGRIRGSAIKKRKRLPDVDFRNGTGLVQFLNVQKSWSRDQ